MQEGEVLAALKRMITHNEKDNLLVALPVNHTISRNKTQIEKLHTIFGVGHDGPIPYPPHPALLCTWTNMACLQPLSYHVVVDKLRRHLIEVL
jgi:hypothetical protein